MLPIWLSKRPDSVSHNSLLLKIMSYDNGGKFLNWIKGFLSDREQYVILRMMIIYRWQNILSGVPQGSILGPLLFTIYVNNSPQFISSSAQYLCSPMIKINVVHSDCC